MATSTSTLSFADKIREISKSARENGSKPETIEDWREKKKLDDVNKFFESEVAKTVMQKIEERATEGCLSANIYEYHFSAYFYINKKNEVITVPEFKKDAGFYMHRIHHMVHSDFFQEKLKNLVESFGGNMQFDSWYPGRDKINVVTVFWGPTKTHKFPMVWSEEKAETDNVSEHSDSDSLESAKENKTIPDSKPYMTAVKKISEEAKK